MDRSRESAVRINHNSCLLDFLIFAHCCVLYLNFSVATLGMTGICCDNLLLLFHSVFYPFWELSAIFIKFKIVVCKLFQFGRVWNLVVWERIKKGCHFGSIILWWLSWSNVFQTYSRPPFHRAWLTYMNISLNLDNLLLLSADWEPTHQT